MKPRLKEVTQDCLVEMAREGLILIRQEDLDTNAGQMRVARYAWDVIAAMPDEADREHWIETYADTMHVYSPWLHRDWFKAAIVEGVKKRRGEP